MSEGLLSLCWNNHKSTFCHIISSLREKEKYSDVTLACDGKFYPVHKLVLSVCSEYFDTMLSATPCKHPVIVLKDVKPEELEALLRYMYDGIVSVAQNDLARLIKAAEMLRIKGLAVPDEAPNLTEIRKQTCKITGSSNSSQVLGIALKDNRTSPPSKRKKQEGALNDANVFISTPTTISSVGTSHVTAAVTGTSQTLHFEPSKLRQRLESQRSEQPQLTIRDLKDSSDLGVNTIQVVVDSSLVKEEMVDSEQLNKRASISYGMVVDTSGRTDDRENEQSTQERYNTHSQPLAEAVAEALAGPSTVQTWLSTGEINPTFTTVESYTTEEPGEGKTSVTQSQMVPVDAEGNEIGDAIIEYEQPLNDSPSKESNAESDSSTSANDSQMTDIKLSPKSPSTSGLSSPSARHCPSCPYIASRHDSLEAHIRIHTGEKPFRCMYCPYRTARKWSLSVHMKTHTGEKPYHCPNCTYRAARKDVLNAHLRTHTSTSDRVENTP